MKKNFVNLMFVLLCTATNAQSLNLTQLIAQNKCADADCFAKFVTANGFYYEKSKGGEYSFLGKKTFPSNVPMVSKPNQARFKVSADQQRSIIYTTVSETEYQKQILAYLKENGFQKGKGSSGPDHFSDHYSSSKYPKILLMIRMDTVKENGLEHRMYNTILFFH